jgi:hypothetical protein
MKEYIKVMKPIVETLDIFQGEKNVGLGYLLPTIIFTNQFFVFCKIIPALFIVSPSFLDYLQLT